MGAKKSSKQSSTSYNTWTTPEGQAQLAPTQNAVLEGLRGSSDLAGTSKEYLTSTLQGGGMNPYLEGLMRGIRAENDVNTPSLLAAQRSQYRNTPFATAQFGTDEALRRNAIGRDNALYSALVPAYESGANRQLQAAQLGNTSRSADIAQALQLLDLLKTSYGSGNSTERSMDYGRLIGGLASGVGSLFG